MHRFPAVATTVRAGLQHGLLHDGERAVRWGEDVARHNIYKYVVHVLITLSSSTVSNTPTISRQCARTRNYFKETGRYEHGCTIEGLFIPRHWD